jgi:hypothetical protein
MTSDTVHLHLELSADEWYALNSAVTHEADQVHDTQGQDTRYGAFGYDEDGQPADEDHPMSLEEAEGVFDSLLAKLRAGRSA